MNMSVNHDMDGDILYSILNKKLRNHYQSLDQLCNALMMDKSLLVNRMEQAGYYYVSSIHQFRSSR